MPAGGRDNDMADITLSGPDSVTGDCPYCGKGVRFIVHRPDVMLVLKTRFEPEEDAMSKELRARGFRLRTYHCPGCKGLSIELIKRVPVRGGDSEEQITRLFPRDVVRNPPPEVTNEEI